MRFNSKIIRFAVIGATVLAMTAIAGCREEEQNRPLTYKKGVYQGKTDQQLSDAQRDELRSRARNQAF
jgi:outer membrane murein-binding lipoprotein Lpp